MEAQYRRPSKQSKEPSLDQKNKKFQIFSYICYVYTIQYHHRPPTSHTGMTRQAFI